MRIQHNISAMNSYRNFSTNNSSLAKNLEKLSTGYKINRAGDDAAGLAISEKMRAQITGLEGATENAKDGISLVQTAEGALTEVHDMLNRMTTLAEQSANGTYQDELDREQLQKEVNQLKSEIDRIADSTNFNGLKLLDGSLAETTNTVNNESQMMTIKGSGTATLDTTNTKFVEASMDKYTTAAAANVGVTADKYGAVSIGFTDADGNKYNLTFVGGQAAASGTSTTAALAKGLNGETDATTYKLTLVDAAGKNQDEALKAFRNTFTVDSVTDDNSKTQLTFEVKSTADGATLDSVKFAGESDDADRAKDAVASIGLSLTEGVDAGYQVELGAQPTAHDTFSIGDHVYEFVTAGTTDVNTAGATAVALGAAKDATTKNLYNALVTDGYTVTLDEQTSTDNDRIRFTDMSQISEAQEGAAVSVSSTNLAVENQEAAKQKTSYAIGIGADGDTKSLTINYLDGEGKQTSKTINYTSSNDAGDNLTAMKDALAGDSAISALFSVTESGSNLVIESRNTGTGNSQLLKLSTTDTTATAMGNPTTVETGADDGKVIELKNNSNNIKSGDTVTINGQTYEFASSGSTEIGEGNTRVLMGNSGIESMKNLAAKLTDAGVKNSFDSTTGKISLSDTDNIPEETIGGLSVQIGDTADSYNKLTISVADMHSESIGIGDVDISTQEGAAAALDKIKSAVNFVSDVRGTLGSLQNRLDHTINNLGVMRENIQNAESQIRDTDVAEEMMTYTKNSILNQSAQAMLAQANQLPQGVLQLLQ